MRYHLFLKFVGKVVKIAQTFCLDLAVQRYMSTSVGILMSRYTFEFHALLFVIDT